MAPSRMQFDLSFGAGARPATRRDGDAPLRLLVVADLGGDRSVPLAARKPLALDIDNIDAVVARIAPRLTLTLEGLPATITFASLDDFHPDRLFTRVAAFDTLRRLRQELQDPSQFKRAAASLGLSVPAAPAAAAAPAAGAEAASDIERLLGRKPETTVPTTTPAAAIERWLHDLMAPHVKPDTAHEQRALIAGCDEAVSTLMRTLLHQSEVQALEAAWLGLDRLVRGLELGGTVQLFVLDASAAELLEDIGAHRADLGGSAMHQHLASRAGADGARFSLVALGHTFGPGEQDVQLLASLGAIGSRAGAPVLAAATPACAGAAGREALAHPRSWREAEDESLVHWQALRTSPMAPWIGLVAPRVLMRLPYGAATDRTHAFAFEEMPAERDHGAYLWGSGALAAALLVGRAFTEDGWQMNLASQLDIDDLPSHVYSEDGERHQQPCAELLLSEEAGQALLGRGLMPLLSYRNRNAVRLMRWQSIAEPPQPLQGLG